MSASSDISWINNFIWGIADDVLRDVFSRGKYRDVILPMVVLLRIDGVIKNKKQEVLEMHEALDLKGVTNQEAALRQTSGYPFYNTSKLSLEDLRNSPNQQQLRADFEDW